MAAGFRSTIPCTIKGRRYGVFRFGVTLYQFDTGLESGGDYNVQRYFFRFDAGRQTTAALKAGIGLSYDYEDWDFTGASGFRGLPWGDIHRTGIDLSFQYTGIEDWTLFFLPALQFARESGAEWGDSFQTGAVLRRLTGYRRS